MQKKDKINKYRHMWRVWRSKNSQGGYQPKYDSGVKKILLNKQMPRCDIKSGSIIEKCT